MLALIVASAQPARAETQALYLPALQAAEGADLGLALFNSDSKAAEVRLTARDYNGAIIDGNGSTNPARMHLAGTSKLELRAADIFGIGISTRTGWIEIVPSSPAVKGVAFAFDSGLSFLEGAELTARPSSRLVFPKASIASMTQLSLVNTGSAALEASISLYENNGRLASARQIVMAGFSGFSSSMRELIPVDEGFEGYAIVQTSSNGLPGPATLAGLETYRNRSDIAVVRAVPESARLRSGYWAHFISQAGYSTGLTLVNPGDGTQVLQITADPLTSAPLTVTRLLLPNERLNQTVAEMFGLSGDALVTGYIRFETQGETPGVIGFLDYEITNGSLLSAVEAQSDGVSDAYFTHLAEGDVFHTGLALLNPNAEPSTVLMDMLDQTGNVKASAVLELSPWERKSGLLAEFFQSPIHQIGGYIHLTATHPVHALELLGSQDWTTFLANVPPQSNNLVPASFDLPGSHPAPSIVSISPSSAVIDNLQSLNVRISGSGFTPDLAVNYDGIKMRTSFISSSLIAITLLNAQLKPGNHSIQISSDTVLLTLQTKIQPATPIYYVATTGSDSNSGTSASPWKTIQKAANAVKAGEKVVVHPGTYNERVQVKNSGSAGALITFQAQGTVVMKGFNVSGSYIKIDGFEIADVGGNDLFKRSISSGIYVDGSYVQISNNYIHGTNAAGIFFSSRATGNTISSNRVVNAVECGIYVDGTNHMVVDNDISHTVQTHPGMINADDADGIRFFGSGSIFRRNYIHDITLADAGNTDPHTDGFQTWGPSSNMIIEQNTILQMENPDHDQGVIVEAVNSPVDNITIRNNLFMTKGSTGYSPAVIAGLAGTVSNLYIVNNTMVSLNGPKGYAIWLYKDIRGAVVKNNVIYDHGNSGSPYVGVDAGAAGVDIGFNSISKTDGEAPGGPRYPNDLWMVNPQFVNFAAHDFHLQATSPLINAGTLLSIVPNDFDGVSRPLGGSSDIGAFER